MQRLTDDVITLDSTKSTCMFTIESQVPSNIDWSKEGVIGQGTYGIILKTIPDAKELSPYEWVVKIANRKSSCEPMDHEYNLHSSILDKLKTIKSEIDNPLIINIYTPELTSYYNAGGCCWYYMSRIHYPLDSDLKLVHSTISIDDPGDPRSTTHEHSGLFPSQEDLTEIIDNLNGDLDTNIIDINHLAYCNGFIFGMLHYMDLQIGSDIEIVLGRLTPNDKVSVFFYDFDKSTRWSKIDDNKYNVGGKHINTQKFVKLLSNTMGSAPYCTTIGPIGEQFIKGYMDVSNKTDYVDISQSVIENIREFEEMLMDGGKILNKNIYKRRSKRRYKKRSKRRYKKRSKRASKRRSKQLSKRKSKSKKKN